MDERLERETPSITEFDPSFIPWQERSLKEIFGQYDYSLGVHEVLASGAVGSAKSLWGVHIAIVHLLNNSKARCMIGRQNSPDIRDTVALTIQDHIEGDLVEGQDYEYNDTRMEWNFANGSQIISRSWSKRKWHTFKSLKLSMALIEELTENYGDHWEFYQHVYSRLGRLPNVKQNLFVSLTNPDSPTHPAYKGIIIKSETDPLKHVYYSLTTDNPFLPEWYAKNQMDNLSPIEIERLIKGRWVEDPKGGIYYNYKRERNFRNQPYIYSLNHPIDLMFDFNIGVGKPMSMAVGQVIRGVFHIAHEIHLEGADTHGIMEELAGTGILERKVIFRIFGDATGRSRDTRSKTDDYDIIKRHLKEYRRADNSTVAFEVKVGRSNPPIRTRHNKCNAKFSNFEGKTELYIYKDAEWVDDGFRMTKLVRGGNYLEDDKIPQQHVTTAVGYWVTRILMYENREPMTIRRS